MRYGIFSDVHSNLEAFSAILQCYQNEKIDQFIFLGDIVGYGASPNEAIARLKALNSVCLAGNHDWAVADRINGDSFNAYARQALDWTRVIVDNESKHFLSTLRLFYEADSFICAHGSLEKPETFRYLLSIKDARENFRILKKQILFVGHTHQMRVYIRASGAIAYDTDMVIRLNSDTQYIVNVGSVGQPRDRDRRSCICIYDDREKIIELKRVAYNIEAAADRITQAGLPELLAARLYVGY